MKSCLRPSRRTRLRLTLLAVVALLYQQIALASYVCGRANLPAGDTTMRGHCAGMPMAQIEHAPALCAWHCGQVTASTQDAQTPAVPSLILAAPLPEPGAVSAMPASSRNQRMRDALWRSHGIPPALQFRVLLI